jgi:hypothetical protein
VSTGCGIAVVYETGRLLCYQHCESIVYMLSGVQSRPVASGGLQVKKSEGCAVCRLVRMYLLLAVPLIAVLGTGSMTSYDDKNQNIWFARVELIDFLAAASILGLFAVIAYKLYEEYWIPKRRERAIKDLKDKIGPEKAE